jgi:hypothetical protein
MCGRGREPESCPALCLVRKNRVKGASYFYGCDLREGSCSVAIDSDTANMLQRIAMPNSIPFTVVRLADGACLEEACKLAGVAQREVRLKQTMREKIPAELLSGDYRVITFDGVQITISERIDGERRVRGFAVVDKSCAAEAPRESS